MENTGLIGSALKNKRKELGLSQKEMVGSILSVSYYSKVERNLFDINVNDLTKILALHGIDIIRFFQEIKTNKISKQEILTKKLQQAFYEHNLDKINDVIVQLNELKYNDHLILLAKLMKCSIQNNLKLISSEEKRKIKSEIFNTDNWDTFSLQLFSTSMLIFNFEELTAMVNSIFNHFKMIKSSNKYVQELIASIAINYLQNCYNNNNTKNINQALKQIELLPEDPLFIGYKELALYYKAVFNKDNLSKIAIRKILSESGYNNFFELLPK
ncbi:helix-turn-helix domain-containing protein [uncultured Lactobacillus sp.]|uniref:helix-turn-helix domain-containing protein n=1 Tax=uncultured Lactobacillus sp. TaxID=153152 RepID=UPI00272D3F09|nr:helix-turn-helix domain-containing protein [uncultured Lactobacillus sp.]